VVEVFEGLPAEALAKAGFEVFEAVKKQKRTLPKVGAGCAKVNFYLKQFTT